MTKISMTDISMTKISMTEISDITEHVPIPRSGTGHVMFHTESETEREQPLTTADVGRIINDNIKSAALDYSDDELVIPDPVTRSVIREFESMSLDVNMSKNTKLKAMDKRLLSVLSAYIESVARINIRNYTTEEINELAGKMLGACNDTMHEIRVEPDAGNDMTDRIPDLGLYEKIKAAIDDNTLDGGLTRSGIRKKIGRNHKRYIDVIDDILARLLESGNYSLTGDRYMTVAIDTLNTHRLPTVKHRGRGRPITEKDNDEGITRRVDGRITDFIPMPKKKNSKSKNP